MKKINLILIIAFIITTNNSFSQVKFGIKAGLNLANARIETEDAPNTDVLPSFHIGVILDYSVNDFLAIQPGILISGKGIKYDGLIFGDHVKAEVNPIYIDIPVMFLLRVDIGSAKLFGGVGPYLGIGIAGKYKYNIAGQSEDGDIKWGSDEFTSDLKRGDFGLNFGGGIELVNGLQFSVNYQLGLNNNHPLGSSDLKILNRVLGISIAYLF